MTDQQTNTRRGLCDSFFNDLKEDRKLLNPLLSFVKADNTLMLAIRDNYINIYYRGGSIIKLTWDKGHYNAKFDPNYAEDDKFGRLGLPQIIGTDDQVQKWLDAFPTLKQIMDKWLTKHGKLEREFQQLVVRENNFSILANQTDYFIVDIEAAYPGARFDLLAVKWPATQKDRKNDQVSLVFIEMKYGEKSLTGGAGLAKHLIDFEAFIKNPANLSEIRPTIELQLKQLNELGLLEHTRTENRAFKVTEDKPEVILLLAGYPPQSQRLHNLLFNEEKDVLERYAHQDASFDLKFHWPHSAGYGLFKGDLISLEEFKKRIKSKP